MICICDPIGMFVILIIIKVPPMDLCQVCLDPRRFCA